jgi:hypothetical protein
MAICGKTGEDRAGRRSCSLARKVRGPNLVCQEARGLSEQDPQTAVSHPAYEKYLMVTVERGKLVSEEAIDNIESTRPPGQ